MQFLGRKDNVNCPCGSSCCLLAIFYCHLEDSKLENILNLKSRFRFSKRKPCSTAKIRNNELPLRDLWSYKTTCSLGGVARNIDSHHIPRCRNVTTKSSNLKNNASWYRSSPACVLTFSRSRVWQLWETHNNGPFRTNKTSTWIRK